MSIKNNTTSLQELLEKVNNLPNAGSGGVNLPELTNEGAAEDLMLGKELINDEGNVIIGAFTIDSELTAQDDLISQIQVALQNKASASEPVLQEKTITPTKSVQNVVPDSGYDGLNKVTVNAIPSEYIVPSGTLTITTNGTHDVKNYASATVNVAGSSGGSSEAYELLITDGILRDSEIIEVPANLCRNWYYVTEVDLPSATTTGSYICYGCTNLEQVKMPNCTTIGAYSFYNNTKLQAIDFPKLTSVQGNVFRQCTNVTSVNLPACTSVAANAFQKDTLIEKMDFPVLTSIAATAFDQCSALVTLILRKNQVCTLANVSALNSTPIASGTGYIYVPSTLVDSYKTATNWSTYAAKIRAIEDYPEICGTNNNGNQGQ